MSDDQALLLRYAQSRDAGAFTQLVRRYSTLVFSVACRVTGNAATAEDVTQDCFLKLAGQAATVRGSLPAWLHRVALNRSLDVTRSNATRLRHETRAFVPSDTACEPSWNQIMPLVDAALAKLPDDLREPLVQHFLLDHAQTQIAKDLHIGQATVSRRLQEGIEELRAQLKKAGVVCGTVVLSTALVQNASAAVPTRLSASLVKMAMAGPAAITATTSTAAILAVNAKLIAAVASVVVVGSLLTYHFASLPPTFTPKPYLSKLALKGNGFMQDSFSLAFQAAAKVLGQDTDYETVYALSTNAFCPAIKDTTQDCKSWWHIQSELGDKAIDTLCARFGLVVQSLEPPDLNSDAAAYRSSIAPIISQAMEAENIVLANGSWENSNEPYLPWAGIITDAHSNGVLFGATLNGRQDNLLERPRGVWSLAPAAPTLSPHEADIAALRSAVARIRSQAPFQAVAETAYGLKAMDLWIKAMSETPGFCIKCRDKGESWQCALTNAATTYIASNVAARYLRRIAPDFPPLVQSHLESAAAHYERIEKLISPFAARTNRNPYVNILSNLSTQKNHAANVLAPIKSEYSAIAQDLELALKDVQP